MNCTFKVQPSNCIFLWFLHLFCRRAPFFAVKCYSITIPFVRSHRKVKLLHIYDAQAITTKQHTPTHSTKCLIKKISKVFIANRVHSVQSMRKGNSNDGIRTSTPPPLFNSNVLMAKNDMEHLRNIRRGHYNYITATVRFHLLRRCRSAADIVERAESFCHRRTSFYSHQKPCHGI